MNELREAFTNIFDWQREALALEQERIEASLDFFDHVYPGWEDNVVEPDDRILIPENEVLRDCE